VSTSYNSNCCIEDVSILPVSSRRNVPSPIGDVTNLHNDFFGHDYITKLWSLSPFIDNVVTYIAGYICSKAEKKILCDVCKNMLFCEPNTKFNMNLINIKNRGPLKIPSEDVVSVCKIAERIFRGYKNVK
jgi:hypothetical protein